GNPFLPGTETSLIRASRRHTVDRRPSAPEHKASISKSAALAVLLLVATSILPSGTFASRQPTGSGTAPHSPQVVGADYTLHSSQFADGSLDAKEGSLKNGLTLPSGARNYAYTSEATRAPIDFTDVAPRWW